MVRSAVLDRISPTSAYCDMIGLPQGKLGSSLKGQVQSCQTGLLLHHFRLNPESLRFVRRTKDIMTRSLEALPHLELVFHWRSRQQSSVNPLSALNTPDDWMRVHTSKEGRFRGWRDLRCEQISSIPNVILLKHHQLSIPQARPALRWN